jgi:Ca2+-binding RTX toxin-like protein
MANVVWNLLYDNVNQKSWSDVFGPVFSNGVIQPVSIPTLFHLKNGSNLATFHGNFAFNGAGVLLSGTINSFDLYSGPGAQVLNATGYAIDVVAFKQALAAFQSSDPFALYDLLLSEPMTVHGTVRGDVFGGGNVDDVINGNEGSDKLGGGDGNDQIFGGDYDDGLFGGDGDDTLFGGEGVDHLGGGPGVDTADYATEVNFIAVTLNGPTLVDLLIGGVVADHLADVENVIAGSGNDQLVGDGFNNAFTGNAGDDKLVGNDGNDDLSGGDGKDKLDGGKGNDRVAGGLGKDGLIGGKNSDTLVFDTALDKTDNVDKVKRFSHAKDTFELDQAIFTALDLGTLKGKHFREGAKAEDGNDHVIYDDGQLSYDADGKGGDKAVLFAKLKGNPNLAADDFLVA